MYIYIYYIIYNKFLYTGCLKNFGLVVLTFMFWIEEGVWLKIFQCYILEIMKMSTF